MLTGLAYDEQGRLVDDTGHRWQRVDAWVEPYVAEAAVSAGVRFLVQGCARPPVHGRAERFRRDIKPSLITRADALASADGGRGVTAFVVERWASERDGELLLFVEQGAYARHPAELVNAW